MKKIIYTLCLFSFFLTSAQQKQQFKVTGKVVDKETKQPLEYATIVFTPTNGKRVTGGLTDAKGNFNINVFEGIYNISIEFISFKTYKVSNKVISENLNLGTVALAIDAENLEEVEVIAEKSTVEIRLDKRIYNVGKDMTIKGGTASDVLDNVPSVSVDVEGNVSLRGNENVRILVNGKPSGLVGLSSTDALRQLPADAIQKVEVITSPSARYDAEGTAGILNIILRKGKALGFNGSITSSSGAPELYNIATNLNYRTKKVNFFSNAGYRFRTGPGNSENDITYLDDSGLNESFRSEDRTYERESKGFNTNFGLEYIIDDKSSITGSMVYRNSDGDDLSTNFISNLDLLNTVTYANERLEQEIEEDETIEFSLNYTKDFAKDGHKLTIDLQHGISRETEAAYISDTDLFPIIQVNNPEDNITKEKSKDILLQTDYVLPVGENSQFEFGYKSMLQDLTSDYVVNDPDLAPENDPSNNLDFGQDIHAVYSQFGSKINKFSYLLGLRYEYTDLKIRLEETTENFDKTYSQFFPTINLGYELNDTESFTLGYSRRLRRPRHWFLNPFISRTSETFIFAGNVDLDPTYTNALDLGYLKQWEKFTLNSSIYYQHATNNIEFVNQETGEFVNGVPVIIRQPVNLSSQDRYGFEFTANYNPSRKVRLSGSFNLFNFKTEGDFSYQNNSGETIAQNFDADNTSWFARFNSRVVLPLKIDWQTRMMYRGPQKGAQSDREGIFVANLAFSKDILKEKGTLTLNVSDLFNSRKRESITYTNNTITDGSFQWRERQVTLSFVYRFNQKKKRQRQRNGLNGDDGGEEFGG